MKIMIACQYSPNFAGNFIGSLIELGLFLKENGSKVIYAFPETDVTVRRGAFPDYIRSFELDVLLYKNDDFKTIKGMIEEYNIDLLHIHFGAFLFSILEAEEKLKCKIIFHDHMYYKLGIPEFKQRYWLALDSIKYKKRGINVIGVNKTRSQNYVFTHSKYIPNALSFKRPICNSFTREEIRNRLGLEFDDYVCLIYGYNSEVKGVDIAVKAVGKAREENPRIKLVILGISDGYRKCWQTDFIKNKAEIEPESDWIRYISTTDDMFSLYRSVDVFLSCSRTEAFAYAILEAIATDTACVVSNINGQRWSRQYSKCYMFHNQNADSCAQAILKSINKEQRKASNYQMIVKKYSVKKWCNQVFKEYLRVN